MAKNQEEIEVRDELEDIGSESRVYELGFHLDPELPTDEVKKAYRAMRELIAQKGTIVVESEPENIQLAYTISRQDTAGRRDFNSAYFSWIVYEAAARDHAEVLAAANADARIIRFIDLLADKDAARHFVEARDLSLRAPESAKEPEGTVNAAELDAALEHVAV